MPHENIPATLAKLTVPISKLVFYAKNARIHDMPKIEASLNHHGQYRPIVVRAGTNEILAGNGTVQAALNLGWEHIAATFMDVDDDQAARIVAVDNKLNDEASYDPVKLVDLLTSIPDTKGTGFTDDELDRLIFKVAPEPEQAGTEADELPYGAATGICKTGDLWELGRHRLVVGDATDPDVLRKLMGGDLADCMWTDPPYGVNYVGKTEDALQIQGDSQLGLDALLRGAFGTARAFLRPGAATYVAHADTERVTFEQALKDSGYIVRQNLIWVKNTMVMGHSDYHYKHEPILEAQTPADFVNPAESNAKNHEPVLYGFTEGGTGRLGRGGARWWGENNATTVFEYPKPPASREHPTMKPVALVQAMLKNSCKPNGIVLDPFCGSGSTLIAANYQRVRAFVGELDPKYADVICARYQKLTGELPTRNRKEHDFGGGFSGNDSK
jgi:site-specific DNA-methyltransferase (adenine-specific)